MGIQLVGRGLDRRRRMSRTRIWCELSSGMMWLWGTMPDCGKYFRNWKLVGAGDVMSNSIPGE